MCRNNPDFVWGGIVILDQSRPLTIPPSMIYWSAVHKLPVYAHPRFDPDSTRVYARAHARSNDGFSDFSAAEVRRELGLPPLESPPIVRPRKILYGLGRQWCPDEDVLAEKVAELLPTLRPDDEMLPPLVSEEPLELVATADTSPPLEAHSHPVVHLRNGKRKREDGNPSEEGENELRATGRLPSIELSYPHTVIGSRTVCVRAPFRMLCVRSSTDSLAQNSRPAARLSSFITHG